MALIEVIRERPPSYAKCKGEGCGRLVEWVTTVAGRKMPLNAPVTVERVHERNDGRLVTVVSGDQSHFTSCPGASTFRKKAGRRAKPVQQELFPS